MKKEQLTANVEDGSQAATETLRDYDLAKNALAKSDCIQLFTLYEKAIRQRGELLGVLATLAEWSSNTAQPRYQPSQQSAIDSMERVSLAAIELAKAVSEK